MNDTTPHFSFPFQFEEMSGAATVEQDSYEDVLSCVAAVVVCPIGACSVLPTFGIPDSKFSGSLDGGDVSAAVQYWEPRADATAVAQAVDISAGVWQLTLNAAVPGTGH